MEKDLRVILMNQEKVIGGLPLERLREIEIKTDGFHEEDESTGLWWEKRGWEEEVYAMEKGRTQKKKGGLMASVQIHFSLQRKLSPAISHTRPFPA